MPKSAGNTTTYRLNVTSGSFNVLMKPMNVQKCLIPFHIRLYYIHSMPPIARQQPCTGLTLCSLYFCVYPGAVGGSGSRPGRSNKCVCCEVSGLNLQSRQSPVQWYCVRPPGMTRQEIEFEG